MSMATAKPKKVNHVSEIGFELPDIPCTKYNVIGNSKMRVKRDRRHRDMEKRVWSVPKLVQTTLATKLHHESQSDNTDRVDGDGRSKKRQRPFRQRDGVNSHDRATLYAAKSEDSFKGFDDTHSPKMITLVDDRFKTEKRYISRFYRQRSSALLSPIQKKRSSRAVSISLPSVVQEYNLPDATKVNRISRADEKRHSTIQLEKYHTRDCLYCDVAGQKYCSECRRKHRHIKIRESSPMKTVKFPKLPSCHIHKSDSNMSSNDKLLTKGENQYEQYFGGNRNRVLRSSSFYSDPPAHIKGGVKAKGKKAKVNHTILPRIDLPAITNDADNRHF